MVTGTCTACGTESIGLTGVAPWAPPLSPSLGHMDLMLSLELFEKIE